MLALTLLVLAQYVSSPIVTKRDGTEDRRASAAFNAAPAWAIASAPGGLVVEPVRTAYPKLKCDWTDREARSFIHWRDFEIHAAHEDRDGAFCESNRLWVTTLMGGESEKGTGFIVTQHGAGAYLGRVCRPIEDRDTTGTDCAESRERCASACTPHPHFFSFPAAGAPVVINCVSTDPKRCR